MRNIKIPKQVIVLGLISFFTDFASEMLYPVTPLFLTAALGASMTIVGIIEGFAEVTAGILKGYFGALSDKLGKRQIFISLGYGLSGILKSLPGVFPSLGIVITSRIGDRIGKGIRTAPRDALLSGHSNGNAGAVFGFHRAMDTFGAVAGPLTALGLLFFLPGEYRVIYLAAILPSFFAIYFTFKVKDIKAEFHKKKKYLFAEFLKNAPSSYKKMLLIFAIFSLVNSSDVFLILKSKNISDSDLSALLGYIFYNFIYAAASYPAGIISDKFGKRNVLSFSLIIFASVYLGFAFNENFLFTWVLFALYGIYSASSEGIAKAWISDLTDSEFKGTAIGLFNAVTSFGIMIGSFIAGILWDLFGAEIPFVVSACVSLLTSLIILTVKEKKD